MAADPGLKHGLGLVRVFAQLHEDMGHFLLTSAGQENPLHRHFHNQLRVLLR